MKEVCYKLLKQYCMNNWLTHINAAEHSLQQKFPDTSECYKLTQGPMIISYEQRNVGKTEIGS
jgi:hypothetical protein